jgi:hypothetical protein
LDKWKDGFNHIYLYDKSGSLKQVTTGKWEVTSYYGFDEKSNTLFYQLRMVLLIEQFTVLVWMLRVKKIVYKKQVPIPLHSVKLSIFINKIFKACEAAHEKAY